MIGGARLGGVAWRLGTVPGWSFLSAGREEEGWEGRRRRGRTTTGVGEYKADERKADEMADETEDEKEVGRKDNRLHNVLPTTHNNPSS